MAPTTVPSLDWALRCVKCSRTVGSQPFTVVEVRDPHFHCKFCDVEGEAVWDREGRSKLAPK
jgi:hypothetical protein